MRKLVITQYIWSKFVPFQTCGPTFKTSQDINEVQVGDDVNWTHETKMKEELTKEVIMSIGR